MPGMYLGPFLMPVTLGARPPQKKRHEGWKERGLHFMTILMPDNAIKDNRFIRDSSLRSEYILINSRL
ncbi:MAG: hypothetical protein JXB42_03050 [Deltaproteobacteria bacterium]|nr:hypothetical protein [Deltaproteobacteria bacterium]